MNSENSAANESMGFQPLELMGYFWFVFGVIVLVSTFFVNETPEVPLMRGILTNISAGLVLFLTGLFSIVRGRMKRKQDSVNK